MANYAMTLIAKSSPLRSDGLNDYQNKLSI